VKTDFYQQIEAIKTSLPDVDSWDPPLSGDMDCLIKRDGSWWIDGCEVKNSRLIRLFSTVLKYENDHYYLVTPVEKWRIEVEDLPFMITELNISNQGTNEQCIKVKTSVGDWTTIGPGHNIDSSPIAGLQDEQAIPFVHIRSGLMARFNRNTFVEIAEILQALAESGQYSLTSANRHFKLTL